MLQIFHKKKSVLPIIILAALGYFVDIYDLILFSIVRVSSLKSLGVLESELLSQGVFLLNMQMIGMLIGGIIWGVIADKKGRLYVLFASIITYSLANFANAFVNDVGMYAVLRFIAGIGLAGELGAGICLVSELMPKETRGWGTTIVASVGILGAVVGALVAGKSDWRSAYIIGGVLGMLLLILRISAFESGMFDSIKNDIKIKKGAFHKLFTNFGRFMKYIRSIFIGLPIWFTVGILITFAPEFAKAFGVEGAVTAGNAVMFTYIGLVGGDLLSGYLSQMFKSRKKIICAFILITAVSICVYIFLNKFDSQIFYAICLLLGISNGYWAVFVTNAAEQFGTNLRATVATTVPNFVRGATVPLTISFKFLIDSVGIQYAALIIGMITIIIALVSAVSIDETYGKDLNYTEVL